MAWESMELLIGKMAFIYLAQALPSLLGPYLMSAAL